ncbi:hypothetical protein SWSSV_gp138 [White spot syndrome virus]|uniref:Wsv419 n=5 Tax=White spot syndrome virus TaxID=342409 RepID=Q8VAJ0_WSSVS|nr:wsv419 [Shrimp white spot syndrome virus]YP_009220612.1 hypothetical protein SWSSV_gp138 [White spot syndrome virus]AYW76636.1 hypothetical protein [Procambarus clarkii virus]AAL33421.1 wsv419 [Shrimp white spot syndrome virus]AAL89346.1 WSSV478 [Shrimp white spot syndrome virus]ALN66260.1 hypothetical protein [White spot syndrome virus]ALN66417.1 hypothetical protein [White spot syndrome virus]
MDDSSRKQHQRQQHKLFHDVELHASRLLSSGLLHPREPSTLSDMRQFYFDYKQETTKRAAIILLNTLLEYYRTPSEEWEIPFNLLLNVMNNKWSTLIPGVKISAGIISKLPWTMKTMYEIVSSPNNNNNNGDYYSTCRRMVMEYPIGGLLHTPAITNKYPRSRMVTCTKGKDHQKLYDISRQMFDIIEANGQL